MSCRQGHKFHEPLSQDDLTDLSHKNFSDETMKKVRWVKKMFSDWREYRNNISRGQMIFCDLEDAHTITVENLNFAVCHFIMEVKKLDGSDFPGRTLYDIVICLQFTLEKLGYSFRLLNQDDFKRVRFTLDNLMK